MGPISRYLGPLVRPRRCRSRTPFHVDHELIGEQDIAALKDNILASGLSIFPTGLDGLGVGGNVPRHRQARRSQRGAHSPRAAKSWEINQPAELAKVLQTLEAIQKDFNGAQSDTKDLAGGPDRAGRVCSRRARCEARAGHNGFLSRRGARTRGRRRPMRIRSPYWSRPEMGSATMCGRDTRIGG